MCGRGEHRVRKNTHVIQPPLGQFWEYRFNEEASAVIGVWIRGDD